MTLSSSSSVTDAWIILCPYFPSCVLIILSAEKVHLDCHVLIMGTKFSIIKIMTPKITILHKICDDKNYKYDKNRDIFLMLDPIKAMQNMKKKSFSLGTCNKSLNYN